MCLIDDVVQLPPFVLKSSLITDPGTMLLEVNNRGAIVRALMDLTGEKVRFLSEVEDDAGTLYVGSFREPFISRVRLDQLHSVND